jgi:proteic killer suppression protein
VRTWIETVEFIGVIEIRKYPGLHDEPLKGDRQGQRSVRLNRAYRLIYVETLTEEICIIGVKEIHKHDY